MKYIVLKLARKGTTCELPILFPNGMVHADVAEALRGMPGYTDARPVAAGFISSLNVGRANACHGDSETLKLKSREKQDDALISCHDYLHGIC